jgi:hypothetical protein
MGEIAFVTGQTILSRFCAELAKSIIAPLTPTFPSCDLDSFQHAASSHALPRQIPAACGPTPLN